MKKILGLAVFVLAVALSGTQPAHAGPFNTVMSDWSHKCNVEFRYRTTSAGYPQAQVRVNAITPRDDDVDCHMIDGFGVIVCAAANVPCASSGYPNNLLYHYDVLGNPYNSGCTKPNGYPCGYNLLADPTDESVYNPGQWYSVTDRDSTGDVAVGMIFTLEIFNYDNLCREEVTWQTWQTDGYPNGHIVNVTYPPFYLNPNGCAP